MTRNWKSAIAAVSIIISLVVSASFVAASGSSSFFDHFVSSSDYVNNWVATGVAPTGVGSSIITLTANSTLISKPLFHHGVLTMNMSLANSTMTSALWGWAMQFGGPTFDSGAFYYYNGTNVFAVIGNATDPANQQIAAVATFNVQAYMEYVIEWSYSAGYAPYFTFRVNGGTYTLTPTGSLQMLDYFSPPIVFTVTGTTSAAKLNVDYVSVSDSVVIVQTTTSTVTVPTTKTETVTTTVPVTITSVTTVPVTVTGTSTSWTWVSSTYTYTVPSYTTVGVSTVTRTLTATTTSTSTVTQASTTKTDSVTETVTGYVVVTGTTTSTATTNTTSTSTSTVEAVATVFGFLSLVVVMGVVIAIAGIIFAANRQHIGIPRGRSNQPI